MLTNNKIPRIIAKRNFTLIFLPALIIFLLVSSSDNKITKAPAKNIANVWTVPTELKPIPWAKSQANTDRHRDWIKKKTDKMPELAKKEKRAILIFLSSFKRLANNKKTRPYKIKLKKVSGSKDIPQKL